MLFEEIKAISFGFNDNEGTNPGRTAGAMARKPVGAQSLLCYSKINLDDLIAPPVEVEHPRLP